VLLPGYKVKDNSDAVTARKVVQLYQLPRILVLHLKRFSYTLNGTGKIHKPINYSERLRFASSLFALQEVLGACHEAQLQRVLLFMCLKVVAGLRTVCGPGEAARRLMAALHKGYVLARAAALRLPCATFSCMQRRSSDAVLCWQSLRCLHL